MEQIKSIFYKEIAYPYSNNQYGLAIIIMMQRNVYISIRQVFILLNHQVIILISKNGILLVI